MLQLKNKLSGVSSDTLQKQHVLSMSQYLEMEEFIGQILLKILKRTSLTLLDFWNLSQYGRKDLPLLQFPFIYLIFIYIISIFNILYTCMYVCIYIYIYIHIVFSKL